MTSARIEDYALIGDCETAALVSRDGSIDWLCWPRFDSDACFAALLGEPGNGRWKIAPTAEARISRRYLPRTLVLETRFETEAGAARVTDFMPPRGKASHLVRIVEGEAGEVAFDMELIIRFGYGDAAPWVTRSHDGSLRAIAGPDMLVLRGDAPTRGRKLTTVSSFTVRKGEQVAFTLSYGPSNAPAPPAIDTGKALAGTCEFWETWSAGSQVDGPYAEAMRRSLLTLKALTFAPTGGLVAAPTTSLPEAFGGSRNWDYRYCWLRDATLTLLALMNAGHLDEARDWVHWLRRAVAGEPADLQIMYGIGGERRLLEWQADWLRGYEGSRPVRIGNAAHRQFQLDVYGELMDAFHQARRAGLLDASGWGLERVIADHVAEVWTQPDEGIWEVRGGAHHFTFSKIMAWVALDRAIAGAEEHGHGKVTAPWREARVAIRDEVLQKGVNAGTGAFQRAYDDPSLDASLLLVADLGFVPHDDPRFLATVAAVERTLLTPEGFVLRYDTARVDDGLPPGEAAFLPCSFWLANAYAVTGREAEAKALFERLLSVGNDLGLIAEEFDPAQRRLAGNFPQAFTHVGLLNTALNLTRASKPSLQRASGTPPPQTASGRAGSEPQGDGERAAGQAEQHDRAADQRQDPRREGA